MGVKIGLKIVVSRTSPKLKAKLPPAVFDHAVDDPVIGIDATTATPTNIS
jgi:hypothetical protein